MWTLYGSLGLGSAAIEMALLRRGACQRLHVCWGLFAHQFLPVMSFAPSARARSTSRAGAADLLTAVVLRWSGARAHAR